jgi:hypothetical protein
VGPDLADPGYVIAAAAAVVPVPEVFMRVFTLTTAALVACQGPTGDKVETDRTVITDGSVTYDDVVTTDTITTETGRLDPTDPPPPECPSEAPAPVPVVADPTCHGENIVAPLEARIAWEWRDNVAVPGATDIMVTPVTVELTDDDADGDIDADDVPDLVFAAFIDRYEFPRYGPMVALSGADGAQLWAIQDVEGVPVLPTGGFAAGDLDGDGVTELVAVNKLYQVFAFHPPAGAAPAELVWVAQLPALDTKVFPALADLEGDGSVEVFVGPHVLNADGTLRWSGAFPGDQKQLSFPVDFDGDGLLELVCGNTVFDDDGSVLLQDTAVPGYSVVIDADGDPAPEILRTANSLVEVVDDDGSLVWSVPMPELGGPPLVADFDGDGVSEIGVAFSTRYHTFELDGTPLWDVPMLDSTSSSLSAVAFDFDRDGALEIVLADEDRLWVLDGATGIAELDWTAHGSGTAREYPLVVDLDADGAAEIVLVSNDYYIPGVSGVTVLESATDPWPSAPRLWNQYNYHTDNILPDGTIPAVMARGWTTHNTVRAALDGGPVGFARPDWRVGAPSSCLDECEDDHVVTHVPVQNEGAVDGGPVTLEVTTSAGTTVVDVGVVPVGTEVWVGPFELSSADFVAGVTFAVVPAGRQCDEADDVLVVTTFPCDE